MAPRSLLVSSLAALACPPSVAGIAISRQDLYINAGEGFMPVSDFDKDGVISASDAKRSLLDVHQEASDENVKGVLDSVRMHDMVARSHRAVTVPLNDEQQFKLFDINKDGVLTHQDIAEGLQAFGLDPASNDIASLIQSADSNGDGSIDREEAARRNIEEVPDPGADPMLEDPDSDEEDPDPTKAAALKILSLGRRERKQGEVPYASAKARVLQASLLKKLGSMTNVMEERVGKMEERDKELAAAQQNIVSQQKELETKRDGVKDRATRQQLYEQIELLKAKKDKNNRELQFLREKKRMTEDILKAGKKKTEEDNHQRDNARRNDVADEQHFDQQTKQYLHEKANKEKQDTWEAEATAKKEARDAKEAEVMQERAEMREKAKRQEKIDAELGEMRRSEAAMKHKVEEARAARALAEKRARELSEQLRREETVQQKKEMAVDSAKEKIEAQIDDLRNRGVGPDGTTESVVPMRPSAEEQKLRNIVFDKVMGDVPLTSLLETLKALRVVVEDPDFFSRLDGAAAKVKTLGNQYVEDSNARVEQFRYASKQFPQEVVQLVARVLARAEESLNEHQDQTRKIGEDISRELPPHLLASVMPMLARLSPGVAPRRLNATELATLSLAQACNQTTAIMDDINRYSNLASTREVISATSKMIPQLSKFMPDLTPQVQSMIVTLMDTAHFETQALENASRTLVEFVAPVVVENFKCTWSPQSDAGPRQGAGLLLGLTALAALAATLFA